MQLDGFDLDRWWRFALPAAYVGCGASLGWAGALAVFDLAGAPVAIDVGLFVGIFPLHLGTIVTARRVGWGRELDSDRTLLSSLGQSLLGGVVMVVWILGMGAVNGPFGDSLFLVVPTIFYGAAITVGRAYRRSVRAMAGITRTPPPPVPPPVVGLPGSSGPPAYLVAPPLAPGSAPPDAGGPWPTPVALLSPPRRPAGDVVHGCLLWLIPVAVGAVVIGVSLLRGGGTDPVVGPDDRPFYVATSVAGERIDTRGPSEQPADPPAALRAAACRNYQDFLADRSLGPELAIVDDPGLLRSAELLDGIWADDPVALDAETFLVQQGGVAGARARMVDDGWPVADVEQAERYLAARSQPPTTGAEDHYVVYTTSTTTTRRLLVRLAVDPEAELFDKPRFDRVGEIEVVLPDDEVVLVEDDLCWK